MKIIIFTLIYFKTRKVQIFDNKHDAAHDAQIDISDSYKI